MKHLNNSHRKYNIRERIEEIVEKMYWKNKISKITNRRL